MNLVVDEINTQSREAASMYEASLEPFSVGFDKLLGQHAKEFDRYRLDEVVVAAIAPAVRLSANLVVAGLDIELCRSVAC